MPVTLLVACGDDDEPEHGDHGDHGDEDGGHDDEHSKPVGPPSMATCPDDSTLTYDNFAKGFFSEYCLSCHSKNVKGAARMGAPADHNFDSLAAIELLQDHIDQMAAAGDKQTNVTMPKSNPKPTLAERKKLGEWIACGLKE
jgi:uncharacterized membrane protein